MSTTATANIASEECRLRSTMHRAYPTTAARRAGVLDALLSAQEIAGTLYGYSPARTAHLVDHVLAEQFRTARSQLARWRWWSKRRLRSVYPAVTSAADTIDAEGRSCQIVKAALLRSLVAGVDR